MVEGSRGEPRLLRRMNDHFRRIFTDMDGEDMGVVSVPLVSITGLENRRVLEQVGHIRRGNGLIRMGELRVCTGHFRVLSCDFNP